MMLIFSVGLGYTDLVMVKPALGRGIGALIPSMPHEGGKGHSVAKDVVHALAHGAIIPSSLQPRKHFTEDQLRELMDSIREHGVIQPLIVRKSGDKYELIAGERRWRASGMLGLASVPAIVREADDKEVLEMALIENLQRENLSPLEEANGYARLRKEFKLKQDVIAKRVGKSRAAVANTMRLLDLSEFCQSLLIDTVLSVGHAKVLLGLKNHELQDKAAQDIVRKSLTVRQTEKLVQGILSPALPSSEPVRKSVLPAYVPVCDQLSKQLSTPVAIVNKGSRGTIEISYANRAELLRLLELFGVDALPHL